MKTPSILLQFILVFGTVITTISATPLISTLTDVFCDGALTLASAWIGEAKNVEMKTIICPNSYQRHLDMLALQRQAKNVCGAACATNCFSGAGGGPDPNDCHVIADALRYDSQNIGALFDIGTSSNNTVVMQYSSCKTFFLNQDSVPLTYCRTDWASLIDIVGPNCQAQQNAHGGNRVANDQTWFVQVQAS